MNIRVFALKRELVIRRQKQLEIRGSIIILSAIGNLTNGNQINTVR
jgi:hypothetical protein